MKENKIVIDDSRHDTTKNSDLPPLSSMPDQYKPTGFAEHTARLAAAKAQQAEADEAAQNRLARLDRFRKGALVTALAATAVAGIVKFGGPSIDQDSGHEGGAVPTQEQRNTANIGVVGGQGPQHEEIGTPEPTYDVTVGNPADQLPTQK